MHLFLYLLAINLLTFALYGLDKRAAVRGRRRIPESSLLSFGLAGGTLGAIMAQQRFHHKTRKASFQFKFWALSVIQILLLIVQPGPLRSLLRP